MASNWNKKFNLKICDGPMSYRKVLQYARHLRKNQTPAEAFFWEKVRNRRLFGKKFRRQYVIKHENILGKEKFFIADFYCHAQLLIVEIDGKIHDFQKEYDRVREETLIEMGYTLTRFKNEEVLDEWKKVEVALREILC